MVSAKEQFVMRRLQQFRSTTHPLYDGADLWYWDIRQGIYKLDTKQGHFYRNRMADEQDTWKREVVTLLKDGAYEENLEFNLDDNIVATRDCYVNITTGERIKFSPEFRMTRKLPVFFDPDANCPNINALLDHHMIPQEKSTLFEYLGYSLYPRMDLKAMLWIYGEPNTRKSTFFIETLSAFFGDFHSQEDINNFGKKYKGMKMKNKYINIADDVSGSELDKDTTTFINKFTGGEAEVEVEDKWEKDVVLKNKPKPIFIANKLPPPHKSVEGAFYTRANVVQFLNPVPPAMNTDFVGQYTSKEELSGLLNEMIAGYQRLVARGGFVGQDNSRLMEARYQAGVQGNKMPLSEIPDSFSPVNGQSKLQSYI